MTDVKRCLAIIADACTDAIMRQAQFPSFDGVISDASGTACLRIANEALVAIREQAQDALGALIDEEKNQS